MGIPREVGMDDSCDAVARFRFRAGLAWALFLLLGSSCGADAGSDEEGDGGEDDDESLLCEPAEISACECPGGGEGERACSSSGYEWGPCQCVTDDDGTSSDGPTGDDSGSDTGTGTGADGNDDTGTAGDSGATGSTSGDDTSDGDEATDGDESDTEDGGSGTGGDESGTDTETGTDTDTDTDTDTGTDTDTVGLEIHGDYIDDEGLEHHITTESWTTIFGLYYVVSYDNGDHWAVLYNDPVSWHYAYHWSRFEWEWTEDGRFWYCPVTVSADTREEVETNERPDHSDPATAGCKGGPWIELLPV